MSLLPQGRDEPSAAETSGARPEAPPARLTLQIAYEASDLKQHLLTWQALAERAIEPNVFYEPVPFLVGMECLEEPPPALAVLVYAQDERNGHDEMVGFVPFGLVEGSPFGKLQRFELYQHHNSFLCTPLIDPRYLAPVVDLVLDWIASAPQGVAVFDLPIMNETGPVWRALRQGLASKGLAQRSLLKIERALFLRRDSAEAHLRRCVGAKKRKELRRQRRRLAERGALEFRSFAPGDNIDRWTEQFMKVEASGWKGESDYAFDSEPDRRRYFRRLLRETAENGMLIMQALTLDDRPIALKCSLRSAAQPHAAFAFKIAFDEDYARYSPGVQLEIDNIRQLYEFDPPIDWMDSCAMPDHSMINGLWRDRRPIVGVACAGRDLLSRSQLGLRALFKG